MENEIRCGLDHHSPCSTMMVEVTSGGILAASHMLPELLPGVIHSSMLHLSDFNDNAELSCLPPAG